MARKTVRLSTLELSQEQFRLLIEMLKEKSIAHQIDLGDIVVSPALASSVEEIFQQLKSPPPTESEPLNEIQISLEQDLQAGSNSSRPPVPDSQGAAAGESSQKRKRTAQSPQSLPDSTGDIPDESVPDEHSTRGLTSATEGSPEPPTEGAVESRRQLAFFALTIVIVVLLVQLIRSLNSSDSVTTFEETCSAYTSLRTQLLNGWLINDVASQRATAIDGFKVNAEPGVVNFLSSFEFSGELELSQEERQQYWRDQFSRNDPNVEVADSFCSITSLTTTVAPTTIPQVDYSSYFVTVPEGWVYELKMPIQPFRVTFGESVANSRLGESQLKMTVNGLEKPLIAVDSSATPGRNPPTKEIFVHYYLPTGSWNALPIMKGDTPYDQCRFAAQPNFSCRYVVQTDDIAALRSKSFVSEIEPDSLIKLWVRQANSEASSGIWEVELWTPDTSSMDNCSVYFDADWNLIGPVDAQEFFFGAPELSNITGWSMSDFSRPSCLEVRSETGETPRPLSPGAPAVGRGSSNAANLTDPIPVTRPFPTRIPLGQCSQEAIREDYGVLPFYSVACSGAWAITGIKECPPEMGCEGTDIFRWTDDGWTFRGRYYTLCVLMIDESGMPRSVNDEFFPSNTDCRQPIDIIPESPYGPLSLGDVGERVRSMQRRLIELGLLDDLADARFGPNTRNALYDLQHLTGLSPTGIADEATFAVLGLSFP